MERQKKFQQTATKAQLQRLFSFFTWLTAPNLFHIDITRPRKRQTLGEMKNNSREWHHVFDRHLSPQQMKTWISYLRNLGEPCGEL